jgi:NADP-dependent 3-hydroxy acid dehydrogenase YdfG
LSGALASQVAIVTGAGRGIGRAVARALAAESAAVVLAARTRAELARTASDIRDAGGRALALPTDVTSEREVVGLVEETLGTFERVDILVNAAGHASFGPLAEAKVDQWDAMLTVNLRAVMLACRAVLPAMTRQGRGTIVNVASIAARRAIPGTAVYAATKAGVVAFSHALAEELRPRVRVGVIVPGAVDTPLWDSIPDGPERGRMLAADDVARCAVLMTTLRDGAWLEEVTLMPAGGIL